MATEAVAEEERALEGRSITTAARSWPMELHSQIIPRRVETAATRGRAQPPSAVEAVVKDRMVGPPRRAARRLGPAVPAEIQQQDTAAVLAVVAAVVLGVATAVGGTRRLWRRRRRRRQ